MGLVEIKERQLSKGYLFENLSRFFLFELDMLFNFDAWYIGKINEDGYQILQGEGRLDYFPPGKIMKWSDTICSRMVQFEGPSIVPDISKVKSYSEAKIAINSGIRSYIGAPIFKGENLYGSLAGVSQSIQPVSILKEEKYIYKITKTLSACISNDNKPVDNGVINTAKKNAQFYKKYPEQVGYI